MCTSHLQRYDHLGDTFCLIESLLTTTSDIAVSMKIFLNVCMFGNLDNSSWRGPLVSMRLHMVDSLFSVSEDVLLVILINFDVSRFLCPSRYMHKWKTSLSHSQCTWCSYHRNTISSHPSPWPSWACNDILPPPALPSSVSKYTFDGHFQFCEQTHWDVWVLWGNIHTLQPGGSRLNAMMSHLTGCLRCQGLLSCVD